MEYVSAVPSLEVFSLFSLKTGMSKAETEKIKRSRWSRGGLYVQFCINAHHERSRTSWLLACIFCDGPMLWSGTLCRKTSYPFPSPSFIPNMNKLQVTILYTIQVDHHVGVQVLSYPLSQAQDCQKRNCIFPIK